MAKLSTILDEIDAGSMLLPEFQRGYVWNRDQVRGLMRSVYRGHPVGSFLVWETEPAVGTVRGSVAAGGGVKRLLLDGQQRITSLYGVIRGVQPAFFDGDSAMFTGLHFHVATETFEFYAAAKMKDEPLWIDATSLFATGLKPFFSVLGSQDDGNVYLDRLNTLHSVLQRDFHSEKITGLSKSVDEVVDIFNRVNSGGTKLSKGDLALAKICADSPSARMDMRKLLDSWSAAGYSFTLDWLLRNANAVATGRAPFSALETVSASDFDLALTKTSGYINHFLETLAGILGLDHDRVLMGRGGMPVISRLLHEQSGKFADSQQRSKALYWYVQAAIWGRFAGSTESVLAQDLETLSRGGVDALIDSLTRWRGGNLTVQAHDFEGFGRGSRFYPLLYMLTRTGGAKDFGSGLPLHSQMLGHLATLQVHHIVPKALLYQAGYERGQVNSVANFCFLTQESNLAIGKQDPAKYMPVVEAKHPGALSSQWIPDADQLRAIERYPDFLRARQELLAAAANALLEGLRTGETNAAGPLQRASVEDEVDERALEVQALAERLVDLGCGMPVFDQEIADPVDGRVLAVAEAMWQHGLIAGAERPAILELDPEVADVRRLEELGFTIFTEAGAVEGYVRRANAEAAGPEAELA